MGARAKRIFPMDVSGKCNAKPVELGFFKNVLGLDWYDWTNMPDWLDRKGVMLNGNDGTMKFKSASGWNIEVPFDHAAVVRFVPDGVELVEVLGVEDFEAKYDVK